MFAFIVSFHGGYRIADGLVVFTVKCFRILTKWLVIPHAVGQSTGYEEGLEMERLWIASPVVKRKRILADKLDIKTSP